MDGIIRSKHFDLRYQQRGLTAIAVETLLQYGSAHRVYGGAERLTFTKSVLAEVRIDLGERVFKACERLRNAYIVVSEKGVLITVARSHGKAVH
ncbi:MAG: hypothetical protein R3E14_09415 [Erythrobacter sp.]